MNRESILIVDDETEVLDYLESSLLCYGYTVHSARDGGEALDILAQDRDSIALVVLDLMMPRKDGIETLCEIRKSSKELPVVALSGTSDPSRIVKAMNAGASDFLQKPVAHQKLIETVKKNLGNGRPPAVSKNGKVNGAGDLYHSFRMKSVSASLDQLAPWDVPVVFRGESGVGKEVLVRDLHRRSPRSSKPLVKINCVALPAELLESELFGYEKGAFTGAFQAKPGKFEIANRGTIFLDEIGDMDVKLQAKLLQVLQDGEFYRLGGKEPVKVDVRVVAATHRDLEAAVSEGSFREDLYHRINVVTIRIPPLRDRPEDIIPLAQHFLVKHSKEDTAIPEIPLQLREALVAYHWSGNVRELENLMRKFLVFEDADDLRAELYERSERYWSKVSVDDRPAKSNGHRVAASGAQPNGTVQSSYFDNQSSGDSRIAPSSTALHASSHGARHDVRKSNGHGWVRPADYAAAKEVETKGAWAGPAVADLDADDLHGDMIEPTREAPPPLPTRFAMVADADSSGNGLDRQTESSEVLAAVGVASGNARSPEGESLAGKIQTIAELDEVQRTMEKDIILSRLARTNWNRKQAAKLLGIDYKALLYKMKKLDI